MPPPTSTGNNPRGTNGNGNGNTSTSSNNNTGGAPAANTTTTSTTPQGNTGGEQPAPRPTNNAATSKPAATEDNDEEEDEYDESIALANIKWFNSIPKKDVAVGEIGYTFAEKFGKKWYTGKVVEILPHSRTCVYKEDGDKRPYTVNKLQELKEAAGNRKVPDDEVVDESSNEEGGGVAYTMTELISFAALKKRNSKKCDECDLFAFSIWTRDDDDDDVFYSCVNCSEK